MSTSSSYSKRKNPYLSGSDLPPQGETKTVKRIKKEDEKRRTWGGGNTTNKQESTQPSEPRSTATMKAPPYHREPALSPPVIPGPGPPPSPSLVQCPVCSKQVEEATINDHVDLCIWRASGDAD
ncbi:hypothetical protein BGZ65_001779 [Modicella reniformis]|uniref:UBZ4-type domain-containing protein n=1 Tax=Modicella reniformis TaxID=1440133 RepID=A0A9P6ILN4_9FUNG|nr:hypothetical protein BGZ65_001779 [Modicella reniformis]